MDVRKLDLNSINQPFTVWYEKEIATKFILQHILKAEDEIKTIINKDAKLLDSFYFSYKVLKKSGGTREIFAPTLELKEIQRKIADYLVVNKKQNLNVSYGFELNTNMVVGAQKHINKKVVLNIDLKDFFRSITKNMISESLKKAFNVSKIPWRFLEIVTLHGHLPTGAPSSPVLSNIYCHEMDLELLRFSQDNKLTYTRYADDLTFSTNDFINRNKIIKQITEIIKRYNLEINKKKTKIYKRSYRQEVTGLVVNEKVNLKRKFRYNLKALLYNWKKYGYQKTEATFKQKYPDKDFFSTVKGWIEFYGMVKGKDDVEFKKYQRAFKILYDKEKNLKTFKALLYENQLDNDHST